MDTITEPLVKQIELGRKQVDDEMLIRFVNVFGDDSQGYQASYEEWFISAGGTEAKFFEVLFDTTTCPTADEALADAMPSAKKETEAWLEKPVEELIVEMVASSLDPEQYEISNGYIGSMGMTYKTATDETLAKAVTGAATVNGKSEDEIRQWLMGEGHGAKWCKSPNYTYDHSYGMIRRKRTAAPVVLVKCSCGHSVPRSQVMSASLGTSCPNCYDRLVTGRTQTWTSHIDRHSQANG